jgi:hypothetical protein
MTAIIGFVACFLFAGLVSAAAADSDLKGKWTTQEREGVRQGESDHGLGEDGFTGTKDDEGWSLTVSEVKGRSFVGEWCSSKRCEAFVGVINAQDMLLAADEDGYFIGTRLDDGLELCYLEAGEDLQIADCHKMKMADE